MLDKIDLGTVGDVGELGAATAFALACAAQTVQKLIYYHEKPLVAPKIEDCGNNYNLWILEPGWKTKSP